MASEAKSAAPLSNARFNTWITDHLVRISTVQKILFVYNLYIMTKAGLSIVSALTILAAQVENQRLRSIIKGVKNQVEKGRQLSEALADYPKLFPPIYVSMIAAGESAGKLEGALRQVANQMKKSHELISKVRGALIYPAVVLTAMAGIGVEMVVFVLPKIIGLFNDFSVELPLPTRILVAVVKFTQHWGAWLAIAAVAAVFGLVALLRQPGVKRQVHAVNLRLPIAGEIIKKINLASFTLTLSSLLESALPIVDAVNITGTVQTNVRYRETLNTVAEDLKKGDALSAILGHYPQLFPPLVSQMIMVGEESGQLTTMLGELSQYYRDEVDTTMKNFSTVIEPVIIVLLGLAVAGIAVAVIMPIYSLAENF